MNLGRRQKRRTSTFWSRYLGTWVFRHSLVPWVFSSLDPSKIHIRGAAADGGGEGMNRLQWLIMSTRSICDHHRCCLCQSPAFTRKHPERLWPRYDIGKPKGHICTSAMQTLALGVVCGQCPSAYRVCSLSTWISALKHFTLLPRERGTPTYTDRELLLSCLCRPCSSVLPPPAAKTDARQAQTGQNGG